MKKIIGVYSSGFMGTEFYILDNNELLYFNYYDNDFYKFYYDEGDDDYWAIRFIYE